MGTGTGDSHTWPKVPSRSKLALYVGLCNLSISLLYGSILFIFLPMAWLFQHLLIHLKQPSHLVVTDFLGPVVDT